VICTTALEAMETLREERAQLGIFGLTLPDADGLDLVATVIDQALVQRCMVVSGRRDERVRRVLKSLPICGYFDLGNEKSTALVPALQTIAKGLPYCSRTKPEAECIDSATRIPLHQMFSDRELEIFSILGSGIDDLEAGRLLGMGASTVKSHRSRIMRKLGIQSRAELMREAVFRGVVRFGASRVIRPGFERGLAPCVSLPRFSPQAGSLDTWVVL
jgi:two-component system invasion response regulator UvrY